MSATTGIEWTDATWNPVTGCTEVSPGCDRCYAKTFAERFRGTAGHYFENGFDVQLRPDKLDLPLRWRKPKRVFVNSMSDLFHKDVPDEYIVAVFATMAATPQHTYQILTKRHARLHSLLSSASFEGAVFGMMSSWFDEWGDPRFDVPKDLEVPLQNVWLGVSVENQQWADIRIPALLMTPAAVRFLSCEPLLGPVDLTRVAYTDGGGTHLDVANGRHGVPDLWTAPAKRVDWVIVGGESGHGARPMHPDWARRLRDQCTEAGVPFHFKQWGNWADIEAGGHSAFDYVTDDDRCQVVDTSGRLRGRPWPGWKVQDGTRDASAMRRYNKHESGRELDGRTWDEFPAVAS